MLASLLPLLDTPDEQARFTALYRRHKRLVLHTAAAVLRDEHLAQDVLQDVFLYLAEHFAAIDTASPRKVERYLVLAARTRAINLLHRRAREAPAEGEPLPPREAAPPPPDALIEAEDAARLVSLVAELPPATRAVLELAMQGFETAEIAGLLGVTQAAARQRLVRGRRQLWDALQKEARHAPAETIL